MSVFTPAPGAASLSKMIRAQGTMELKLLLRNGEQLLLAVVIPVLVLLGGVFAADRLGVELTGRAVDVLTPGVLALAVMSSAFTSLAIATGFERRYGVIKRLGASPLPRSGLLLGKVGALSTILLGQLLLIGVVGLLLGWQPDWVGLVPALVAVVLGVAAFGALGMLIAGVLRAEATLGAANLIYLLLMAGGGVVLPSMSYGVLAPVVRLLPSGALGDALRSALQHGEWQPVALATLLVWAAVGTVLTARTFRWE